MIGIREELLWAEEADTAGRLAFPGHVTAKELRIETEDFVGHVTAIDLETKRTAEIPAQMKPLMCTGSTRIRRCSRSIPRFSGSFAVRRA